MIRRSVVLPEPEGPSRASSAPLGTSRLRLSRARKSSKRLLTVVTRMLIFSQGYHVGVGPVDRSPPAAGTSGRIARATRPWAGVDRREPHGNFLRAARVVKDEAVFRR